MDSVPIMAEDSEGGRRISVLSSSNHQEAAVHFNDLALDEARTL